MNIESLDEGQLQYETNDDEHDVPAEGAGDQHDVVVVVLFPLEERIRWVWWIENEANLKEPCSLNRIND